jgi:hypothetical protein
MNFNFNNEKIKKSREDNFEEFNATICNDDNFKLSQRNLIMIYIFLYIFSINNNVTDYENYLNKTTYFNKIIFLKYLILFRNLNKLQQKISKETKYKILNLRNEIIEIDEEIEQREADIEEYEKNPNKIREFEKRKEEIETIIKNTKRKFNKENKKIENFKNKFILNTTNILSENNYIYNFNFSPQDVGTNAIEEIVTTLFDSNIIDNIYNIVIKNINNKPSSFDEYKTLFHLNPINNNSSAKAIFYISVHGTFFIVVPNNTYLTIASPVNTTINRWGTRGDPTMYFNSMNYTFKQCLLTYGDDLTNDEADNCFKLLGTSQEDFNFHTKQTTRAYCELEPEPNNVFSNKTDFNENEKIRIKHYIIDSYDFMIFNNDYTIPTNLPLKIPGLNNIQFNTAENIIKLNFFLFNNNINFNVFNTLNIENETEDDDTDYLYPDIGLYTKDYTDPNNEKLQSHLHNFYFPFDIFPFYSDFDLFTEDFALDREIIALNDINIHLQYENVVRSFMLLKGDSFSCNPYIIEYFIKTFKSKITIRPGPILGNKEDEIFKNNKDKYTTGEQGSTITCLSSGLSCYKVTLSVLTNYEILKFCKDANINTCDLYDTSCQSFQYINEHGDSENMDDYENPQKPTLQRMQSVEDISILETYDNLSDLMFNRVIENSLVENTKKRKRGGRTQKRKRGGKTQKRKRGGKTQKRKNRKNIVINKK